jgi:hypothetical protein
VRKTNVLPPPKQDRLSCSLLSVFGTYEDRDLCRSCFDKLESNKLEEVSLCHGHKFLELNDPSILRSSPNKNGETSSSVKQWLKGIAET